ncbi:MAG TPA: carbon-nitrogen hydrolase family protein [Anaerolineales bacterium]|nr:carbon-nitrogen hydrolase family protein [Anaerolineales bacterium]
MRLLACQIEIPVITTVNKRRAHLRRVIEKIRTNLMTSEQKTDLVVLPELSTIDYSRAAFRALPQLAEPLDGESASLFAQLAQEQEVFISFGMPRVESENFYISQIVVDSRGAYVGHYDKLHIAHFGASMEKDYFCTGSHLFTFDLRGMKVAPIICYDHRFPELLKRLCVDEGVDLILHSVAFYADGSYPSWHPFVITRALENQVYYLSLNRAGERFGASIFCPPWVDHQVGAQVFSKVETFRFFDLDAEAIQRSRATYPLRLDRRDDYAALPLL